MSSVLEMSVKRLAIFLFLAAFLSLQTFASAAGNCPQVLMKTNFGDITIELYNDKAPITIENFLRYVRSNYYQDLLFHRVISNFMIQGGGYYIKLPYIYEASTYPPIINESYNGLSNLRGTIAMARTSDPNSATSQFYINLVNNTSLDRTTGNAGYCVFGNVISGMTVVDAIGNTPVVYISSNFQDFPYPTMVTILQIQLLTPGYWLNADLNNDGIVDFHDYAYFAANWRKTGSALWGDFDNNLTVNSNDLRLFSDKWLQKTSWYHIPGDIDGDGVVNLVDFSILSSNWQQTGKLLSGDFNNDDTVDYLDLLILADNWLKKSN